MTHPTAVGQLAPDVAETIRYSRSLADVCAQRDRARRSAKELQAQLGLAWERVDQLHKALTAAEAARDRYRHQADLANTERARLAEELAGLNAPGLLVAAAADAVDVRVCWRCSCTEDRACEGGCGWATRAEQLAVGLQPSDVDLCTACLHDLVRVRDSRRPWWRRMFPG